jgi:hypothetical protein
MEAAPRFIKEKSIEIEKTTAPVGAVADPENLLVDVGGDVAEHLAQLGANLSHGRDHHDGDQSCEQAVFDGGGAGFVIPEADNKILHIFGS